MKLKVTLLFLSLALLLFGQTMSTASSVTVDQATDLYYRSGELRARGVVFMGNNSDSKVELIYSLSGTSVTRLRGSGTPTVTYGNGSVNVAGDLTGTRVVRERIAQTFIQRQEYIEGVPVGERVKRSKNNVDEVSATVAVNRTFMVPSFQALDSNDNFTRKDSTSYDATAFIGKRGTLIAIPINDTDGNEIGKIFAFRLIIEIYLFETSTETVLGHYLSFDRGYGNLIPRKVINYLKNSRVENRINSAVIGHERYDNATSKPRVRWLDLGYNETLGLNMYKGLYNFKRSFELIITPPQSTSLGLSAVSAGIAQFADEVITENSITEFDEDNVDALDTEIVDEVLVSESVSVDDFAQVAEATEDLPLPYPFAVTAIFLTTFVLIRKRKLNK